MLGQHQHLFIGGHLQQPDPQQRTVLQVERPADLIANKRLDLLGLVGRGQVEKQRLQQRNGLGMDDQERTLVLLDKGRAQTLVTLHQCA